MAGSGDKKGRKTLMFSSGAQAGAPASCENGEGIIDEEHVPSRVSCYPAATIDDDVTRQIEAAEMERNANINASVNSYGGKRESSRKARQVPTSAVIHAAAPATGTENSGSRKSATRVKAPRPPSQAQLLREAVAAQGRTTPRPKPRKSVPFLPVPPPPSVDEETLRRRAAEARAYALSETSSSGSTKTKKAGPTSTSVNPAKLAQNQVGMQPAQHTQHPGTAAAGQTPPYHHHHHHHHHHHPPPYQYPGYPPYYYPPPPYAYPPPPPPNTAGEVARSASHHPPPPPPPPYGYHYPPPHVPPATPHAPAGAPTPVPAPEVPTAFAASGKVAIPHSAVPPGGKAPPANVPVATIMQSVPRQNSLTHHAGGKRLLTTAYKPLPSTTTITAITTDSTAVEPLSLLRFDSSNEGDDYVKFVRSLGLDDASVQMTPEDEDEEEEFQDVDDEEEDDDEDDDDTEADLVQQQADPSSSVGKELQKEAEPSTNKSDKNSDVAHQQKPQPQVELSSPAKKRTASLLDDLPEFDPDFYRELEEEIGGLEEEDLEAAVASLLGTTSTSYAHAQIQEDTNAGHGSGGSGSGGGENKNISSIFTAEANADQKEAEPAAPHQAAKARDETPGQEVGTPLRHATGMRTKTAVTQQQVDRLKALLNRHYQILIQQAVLAIQAAHLAKTHRIRDKTDFLSNETADDLIQVLDAAVGMVQDLDQNRKDAIRNAIQFEDAMPSSSDTTLGSEKRPIQKREAGTAKIRSDPYAVDARPPRDHRRLTRAAFSKTLRQQTEERNSVFNIKGLHRLQETFHALDRSIGTGLDPYHNEDGSDKHYTDTCRKMLTEAGADYEEKLIPGNRDLSELYSTPQEYLGDNFSPPCSEEQERFLRRFKTLFTSGEDNLVLRGVNLYGEKQWILIADRYLPDRTINTISQRYSKLCLMLYKAHGIHIDAEGNLLKPPKLESVEDIDDEKVAVIERAAPPAILNVHRWSLEEDVTILRAVPLMGHMWAELGARLIPHRDRGHLRKRYQVLERRVKATVQRSLKGGDSVTKMASKIREREQLQKEERARQELKRREEIRELNAKQLQEKRLREHQRRQKWIHREAVLFQPYHPYHPHPHSHPPHHAPVPVPQKVSVVVGGAKVVVQATSQPKSKPMPPRTEPMPPLAQPVPPLTQPNPPLTQPMPPLTQPLPPLTATQPMPPLIQPIPPLTQPPASTAPPPFPEVAPVQPADSTKEQATSQPPQATKVPPSKVAQPGPTLPTKVTKASAEIFSAVKQSPTAPPLPTKTPHPPKSVPTTQAPPPEKFATSTSFQRKAGPSSKASSSELPDTPTPSNKAASQHTGDKNAEGQRGRNGLSSHVARIKGMTQSEVESEIVDTLASRLAQPGPTAREEEKTPILEASTKTGDAGNDKHQSMHPKANKPGKTNSVKRKNTLPTTRSSKRLRTSQPSLARKSPLLFRGRSGLSSSKKGKSSSAGSSSSQSAKAGSASSNEEVTGTTSSVSSDACGIGAAVSSSRSDASAVASDEDSSALSSSRLNESVKGTANKKRRLSPDVDSKILEGNGTFDGMNFDESNGDKKLSHSNPTSRSNRSEISANDLEVISALSSLSNSPSLIPAAAAPTSNPTTTADNGAHQSGASEPKRLSPRKTARAAVAAAAAASSAATAATSAEDIAASSSTTAAASSRAVSKKKQVAFQIDGSTYRKESNSDGKSFFDQISTRVESQSDPKRGKRKLDFEEKE